MNRRQNIYLIHLLILLFLPGSLTGQSVAGTGNEQIIRPLSGESVSKYVHNYHEATRCFAHGQDQGLRITENGWAEITPPHWLTAGGGTISFWLKPLWKKGIRDSRVIMTMPWGDFKKSYLAISQGWWEPAGNGLLYFILSNEETVHCSVPYSLDTDAWTKITVTWQGGVKGFCRLYIDGERVAEHIVSFGGDYHAKGPIFLGSDQGSKVQRSRKADFVMADLSIQSAPLNDERILRGFEAEDDGSAEVERKKRRWLDEQLFAGFNKDRSNPDTNLKSPERRVMFDEGHEWATSNEETDRLINRLKSAGFNVYVPCVWHGRGTTWPAKIAYADSRLARKLGTGHDPLAYLLEKAHAAGIEVHPWFTVVRRDDNVYRQFYDVATPKYAFDVHNAEFRKFIVGLMLDIVKRYPVDGVNLDYIRSVGDCSCEQCSSGYQERFGRILREDLARKSAEKEPLPSLVQWHSEAVSEIVQQFSIESRKIKPGLVISVDALPLTTDALSQGQDSIRWANSGWVDVIFSMDYSQTIDLIQAARVRKALKQPEKLTLLVSTYDLVETKMVRQSEQDRVIGSAHGKTVVARQPELLADYVRLSRKLWPGSGLSFYLEKFLADFQSDELRRTVYREPVAPAWPQAGSGSARQQR